VQFRVSFETYLALFFLRGGSAQLAKLMSIEFIRNSTVNFFCSEPHLSTLLLGWFLVESGCYFHPNENYPHEVEISTNLVAITT